MPSTQRTKSKNRFETRYKILEELKKANEGFEVPSQANFKATLNLGI